MKKRRIMVTMFAIAVGIVMVSTTPVEGGKGLPNRWALEEDGSKGERGKNDRHHGRRWDRGDRIFRGLDLTEDQKQEMSQIKRLFREEVKELYTVHRENMMGVLTSTQQDTMRQRMEKIKAFRENRGSWQREKLRRHRGDFPGPIENDVEGAAKSATDKPVVTEGDKTTWGKVKNLFE